MWLILEIWRDVSVNLVINDSDYGLLPVWCQTHLFQRCMQYRGLNKIVSILQTLFSNSFSSMKSEPMLVCCPTKFWNLWVVAFNWISWFTRNMVTYWVIVGKLFDLGPWIIENVCNWQHLTISIINSSQQLSFKTPWVCPMWGLALSHAMLLIETFGSDFIEIGIKTHTKISSGNHFVQALMCYTLNHQIGDYYTCRVHDFVVYEKYVWNNFQSTCCI